MFFLKRPTTFRPFLNEKERRESPGGQTLLGSPIKEKVKGKKELFNRKKTKETMPEKPQNGPRFSIASCPNTLQKPFQKERTTPPLQEMNEFKATLKRSLKEPNAQKQTIEFQPTSIAPTRGMERCLRAVRPLARGVGRERKAKQVFPSLLSLFPFAKEEKFPP